jgi:hypothetical protein
LSNPQFYQTPVELDAVAHRDWKLRPLNNALFARKAHGVMLLASEFFDAAREYAIIFVRDSGVIVPVVMLGLTEGDNLFMDDAGRWYSEYLPAYIRRYPFVLSQPVEGQTVLAVDTSCAAVVTDGGEGQRIFEADGSYTEALQTIQKFVSQFHDSYNLTLAFTRELDGLGLFRETSLSAIMKADGAKYNVGGFLVVDEDKLQALPDDKIAHLHRNGALRGIHTHLFSLTNVNRLIDRLATRKKAA